MQTISADQPKTHPIGSDADVFVPRVLPAWCTNDTRTASEVDVF